MHHWKWSRSTCIHNGSNAKLSKVSFFAYNLVDLLDNHLGDKSRGIKRLLVFEFVKLSLYRMPSFWSLMNLSGEIWFSVYILSDFLEPCLSESLFSFSMFHSFVWCDELSFMSTTSLSQIVVCSNHMELQDDVNQVVIHELIHAYDECRAANLDWSNCAHHACSEVW